MKITILGSGASGGVPVIGPTWGNCDPDNPRNRRRRASILVDDGDRILMVDASPDCRAQLLDANVSRLDALLFSHAHADHCHGIDDLRWVNNAMKRQLDVYSDAKTFHEINTRFGYAFAPFEDLASGYFYRPALVWHEITGPFTAAGIGVVPFEQDHGFSKTLGFRFGRMAYSTDVVELDEAAFEVLAGVEVWIVGCLREAQHHTHANVDKVLGWAERLGPRRVVLSHMSHWLDYETLRRQLPEGIEPAYDGMIVDENDLL